MQKLDEKHARMLQEDDVHLASLHRRMTPDFGRWYRRRWAVGVAVALVLVLGVPLSVAAATGRHPGYLLTGADALPVVADSEADAALALDCANSLLQPDPSATTNNLAI